MPGRHVPKVWTYARSPQGEKKVRAGSEYYLYNKHIFRLVYSKVIHFASSRRLMNQDYRKQQSKEREMLPASLRQEGTWIASQIEIEIQIKEIWHLKERKEPEINWVKGRWVVVSREDSPPCSHINMMPHTHTHTHIHIHEAFFYHFLIICPWTGNNIPCARIPPDKGKSAKSLLYSFTKHAFWSIKVSFFY